MCGRYVLRTPVEELRRVFDCIERPNLMPRYNIAPTQDVPVIRQRRKPPGERTLQMLRWGLVPGFAEDPKMGARLINARAETVAEKASFRTAFLKRRCLVPADGFYEWRADGTRKQPYLIQRRDRGVFAFAGLWDRWTPQEKREGEGPDFIDSFTIITTEANSLLRPLHERMPVILDADQYAPWLDPDGAPKRLLTMLKPAPEEWLSYGPVGVEVNAARAEGAGLVELTGIEVIAA
ncbi:MAG TPA: SOS response-associated peptidase [Stellaceae bacterium]|nr:SOS response-associated peptidase [Stellaceae bacterium]